MNESIMIGKVQYVDTGNVTINIEKDELVNSVQVNQIVQVNSSKTNEKIIGLVTKILRKASPVDGEGDLITAIQENTIRVNLVGTLKEKDGTKNHVFKRTLNTVPSLDADCYLLQGQDLSDFMRAISSGSSNPLTIGKYTMSEDSVANLDGNKFFQRHAVIVGGTGSGKSWTVANILAKAADLQSVNVVVFDIHGEYVPLKDLANAQLLKIAGPGEKPDNEQAVFLPYWLLSYEEMAAMLLDRSDTNAPNQSRALFDLILREKTRTVQESKDSATEANMTVESPVPYKILAVLDELKRLDAEMVQGVRGDKLGPLNGKLTRFIQRLESKIMDKRLNFLFNNDVSLLEYDWLPKLLEKILGFGNNNGVKIIDFSEVPSDILPLITGLIGRLIFTVQQWTDADERHPIAIFCDEAHLYLPVTAADNLDERGLRNFERIAKEGRKYGVSLVVISQRPADVSKTILSQCGNFIAMRLTNPEDQNVIRRLFPDNLGDFAEMLPILDVGEGLVVGDASLLPSRVILDKPKIQPNSSTVDFWDKWAEDKKSSTWDNAVKALRQQQKS
ncbi:MAG: ATP-binding protein [Bacteroidota bacterium]|nr:ATP-binding protein [Bacteroidota bacterium]